MTTVVNIKRGEAYDVYIGRAGHGLDGYFGNPFRIGAPALAAYNYGNYSVTVGYRATSRDIAIEDFRAYFMGRVVFDPEFRRRVLALRGKRLGCFCAPLACHGDVIANWVDAQPEG